MDPASGPAGCRSEQMWARNAWMFAMHACRFSGLELTGERRGSRSTTNGDRSSRADTSSTRRGENPYGSKLSDGCRDRLWGRL